MRASSNAARKRPRSAVFGGGHCEDCAEPDGGRGLVRLDRGTEDDPQASYTATHRLRVQLREIALRRLFEMAQLCTARR